MQAIFVTEMSVQQKGFVSDTLKVIQKDSSNRKGNLAVRI